MEFPLLLDSTRRPRASQGVWRAESEQNPLGAGFGEQTDGRGADLEWQQGDPPPHWEIRRRLRLDTTCLFMLPAP